MNERLKERLRKNERAMIDLWRTEKLLAKIKKDIEKISRVIADEAALTIANGQMDIIDQTSADLAPHDGALHIALWLGDDDLAADAKRFNLADAFDDLANETWGMEAEPESLAVMDAFLERAKAARDKLAARVAAARPKPLDIFSDEEEAP